MTICLKCHCPLKNPPVNGMGPVCAKAAQPMATGEPDLFGYDIDAAVRAARVRLLAFVTTRAWLAMHAIKAEFKDARARLEVRP